MVMFKILKQQGEKKTSPHTSSKIQTGCLWLYYASVVVCASCYELFAVVQTRGESEIGNGLWGIMFFSRTALALLTVGMMASIHKTVQTNTGTYSYVECILKNKGNYRIKHKQRFSRKQICTLIVLVRRKTTSEYHLLTKSTCSHPTNTHSCTLS